MILMKNRYKTIFLVVFFGMILGGILTVFHYDRKDTVVEEGTFQSSSVRLEKEVIETQTNHILMDVPMENQYDPIALENGCEVASLAMLLRYYDFETDKNKLADKLEYVPVYTEDGLNGNPHDGFVGDITGGDNAMGVAVEPIEKVAKEVVGNNYKVVASSTTSFEELEEIVLQEKPVWVITTIDFKVPTTDDFIYWDTSSGKVKVTPLCHAAVITGVDDTTVYVNDPFGEKNMAVPKSQFIAVYEAMGQQSLYLD